MIVEEHAPPRPVVDFLQRVFEFAETLNEREAQALRRLVRAGLIADDGTITTILDSDASGYAADNVAALAAACPPWYWDSLQHVEKHADTNPLVRLYR